MFNQFMAVILMFQFAFAYTNRPQSPTSTTTVVAFKSWSFKNLLFVVHQIIISSFCRLTTLLFFFFNQSSQIASFMGNNYYNHSLYFNRSSYSSINFICCFILNFSLHHDFSNCNLFKANSLFATFFFFFSTSMTLWW